MALVSCGNPLSRFGLRVPRLSLWLIGALAHASGWCACRLSLPLIETLARASGRWGSVDRHAKLLARARLTTDHGQRTTDKGRNGFVSQKLVAIATVCHFTT